MHAEVADIHLSLYAKWSLVCANCLKPIRQHCSKLSEQCCRSPSLKVAIFITKLIIQWRVFRKPLRLLTR